ncbi:MAG: nicotinate phosphoribosyltransferase [SAR202 cluster bacterium]|nr:nicotinate phosphoribosyltransferase [SAR202 cluster bacterium]
MPNNNADLSLFSDFYELTMAEAYWKSGLDDRAVFSLYVRSYGPGRGYYVFAGLNEVLSYLESFRFSDEAVEYLGSEHHFDDGFLQYLSNLRFTGDVRAMTEGGIFFADEPVLELNASIIEAQLVETYLLNQINLQTILTTKASRVMSAAGGKAVVDFGSRRSHGVDSALKMARAGYLAGFGGTSNVMASKRYSIPTFGTMGHSFVTSFPREIDAFRAYAKSFPDTSVFLVDTYDPIDGTKNAVTVGLEMLREGHYLRGIRLDSGDLLNLSGKCRALLDEAELRFVRIFASGGLDEYEVERLVKGGAAIDGFGVGTKVAVSADASWTDCAYKLVEYGGVPTLKLSAGKETLPGAKQVYRCYDNQGLYDRDVISMEDEEPAQDGGEPLLQEVMRGGRRVKTAPGLEELREFHLSEMAKLPEQFKDINAKARFNVEISPGLESLRKRVVQRVLTKELGE